MDEEGTRRNTQNTGAEASASGGWTNTTVAAKALGVSPRTVQTYIRKGLLQGKVEGEGVRRTWHVSIDSLNALRAQRIAEGDLAGFREDSAEQVAEGIAEGIAEAMQNLSERLAEEAARAAEYRTRLELTEQAQSTIQEQARKIQEEARQLREENDQLRRELEALREARESPETASESPTASREDWPLRHEGETYGTSAEEAEESLQRRSSWWRRFFGFE